jgi:REP element-mobilizing transposase RayT
MAIYNDDVDRCRFLAILETVVERYRVECHAYCLMTNHYHLVLRTQDANLSSAIQYLNGVYAQGTRGTGAWGTSCRAASRRSSFSRRLLSRRAATWF